MWLSARACPVFAERKIRVRTLTKTVLISGHVSSILVRIVHQLLPFRSVPFLSVPGFPASLTAMVYMGFIPVAASFNFPRQVVISLMALNCGSWQYNYAYLCGLY